MILEDGREGRGGTYDGWGEVEPKRSRVKVARRDNTRHNRSTSRPRVDNREHGVKVPAVGTGRKDYEKNGRPRKRAEPSRENVRLQ